MNNKGILDTKGIKGTLGILGIFELVPDSAPSAFGAGIFINELIQSHIIDYAHSAHGALCVLSLPAVLPHGWQSNPPGSVHSSRPWWEPQQGRITYMNLVEANRAMDHGNTLPTPDELNCIMEGAFVRLQLDSGTRFHARVTEARPNGIYVGKSIDNSEPIKVGDECFFGREHVFEIM